MRKISYLFNVGITICLVVLTACNSEKDRREEEISKIDLDVRFTRFDSIFVEADSGDLGRLKSNFPYLFPGDDSIYFAMIRDTVQEQLYRQVDSVFGNFSREKAEIRDLFRYIRYYFPEQPLPEVLTLLNQVAYRDRVIWTDSILLISPDNYLGADHMFYRSFPVYIRAELDRDYLMADIARRFAYRLVPSGSGRALLDRMVFQGKVAYLIGKLLPNAREGIELHYTKDQLNWALANEEAIWSYFVFNEYLYSTDTKRIRDFMDPAPFSKFGLELDKESPPRIGWYIGYRIVQAYMEREEATLDKMLNTDARELFEQSYYKPKRTYERS